jgi:hypothetical protein
MTAIQRRKEVAPILFETTPRKYIVHDLQTCYLTVFLFMSMQTWLPIAAFTEVIKYENDDNECDYLTLALSTTGNVTWCETCVEDECNVDQYQNA